MKAALGCVAAGMAIGAAVTVLLTRKPGEEIRKWAADKCFDAIDATNKKVWESRERVKEAVDRGQLQITEAVAAGRKSFGKHGAESPVAAL
jgi:gas vesicle protein